MSTKIKEKNLRLRQILGIISLVVIIGNIFLRFAFKFYNDLVFLIVIIIVAIIAWPVMNWLKK
jgi:predicted PurR-regulated permease PerM